MVKKIFILAVVLVLGIVCGILYEKYRKEKRLMEEHVALRKLSNHVVDVLEDYKKENGSYPESLEELEIGSEKPNESREEMLRQFYYERRDDSYILILRE